MKITAEFDSYEEFIGFMNGAGERKLIEVVTGEAQKPQEAPEKSEAKKSTPKKAEAPEEATQTSEPKKETAQKTDEAPKIDESYRTKVRKTLASLNKKTGTNTASELIHTFGVEKFTEVALEDLPALMQKAEEALNA